MISLDDIFLEWLNFYFRLINFSEIYLYSNFQLMQIIILLMVILLLMYSRLFNQFILTWKYFWKYFQSHCLHCKDYENQIDSHNTNFNYQLDLSIIQFIFISSHSFGCCLIKLIYHVILIYSMNYLLLIFYLTLFMMHNFLICFQFD